MSQLGRFKEVPVRELWKNEQYDFSTWLAKSENIEYLNNILGLTLDDVKTEEYVGSYRCDLVAKDEASNIKVVIENQLEATNHDHLGKIITYASGLDAQVICWIVTEAREEHRSAIEWLNNHTTSDVDFFLIEIHAYKIGDSLPAPMFEVIEKPNDFIKSGKNNDSTAGLGKSNIFCLEFWEKFNTLIIEKGKPFNVRKATPDHWYDIAVGSTSCHMQITLSNIEHRIGISLYIPNNKILYRKLEENRPEIDEQIQYDLKWINNEDIKTSKIITYIDGLDFDNQENYPELMRKTIEIVVEMRKIFKKYL